MPFKILFYGEQRGLGIERIEDGLDHQNIRATVEEATHRFGVAFHQFVKGYIARSGIVHIRRDRGGTSGRAQYARDKARLVRCGKFVAQSARQLSSGHVQLVHQMLHLVIRHRDGVGVEGAGLQNIRTRFQILAMDAADYVWLGQHQQVVIAFYVNWVVSEGAARTVIIAVQLRAAIMRLGQLVALNHGAHGSVQDQDALLKEFFDDVRRVAHGSRLRY